MLTSRSRDVLIYMSVREIFEIPILCETEAWNLLKQKVGNCVDSLDFSNMAKEVANECEGLPIALVTVAEGLRDLRAKSTWEDALQQLRSCNPVNIPVVLEKVCTPLKLTYDSLCCEPARSLFFLCCLFSKNEDIPVKLLSFCCLGLHLFEGISCVKDATNRTHLVVHIHILKSHFLLLDGRDKHHIKMHGVVRDAAIFSENLLTGHSWISLDLKKSIGFPVGLNYPRPRLLLINDERSVYHHNCYEYQGLDDSFFLGMEELNVVSLSSPHYKSLPHTIPLLKNLRSLHLRGCQVENISVVGELISLEILTCFSCSKIKKLPLEIGNLNRLKLLEILYCPELKTIVAGVISKLVNLEELHITSSFKGWEEGEEGKERKNAALYELECLSALMVLKKHIVCYDDYFKLVDAYLLMDRSIYNHGLTVTP